MPSHRRSLKDFGALSPPYNCQHITNLPLHALASGEWGKHTINCDMYTLNRFILGDWISYEIENLDAVYHFVDDMCSLTNKPGFGSPAFLPTNFVTGRLYVTTFCLYFFMYFREV